MRRYILLFFTVLLAQFVTAQNYLDLSVPLPAEESIYEEIVLEDCTYIRETSSYGGIYLYQAGMSRKEKATYLNGEEVPMELYMTKKGAFTVKPDGPKAKLIRKIVDDAFTINQADSLDGRFMVTTVRVSSTTGLVTDVYFHFAADTYYTKVPVEVYRRIEQRFKSELQFEITDFGKSLTFSSFGWAQCPKGRDEENPLTLLDENGNLITIQDGKTNTTLTDATDVTP